VKFWFPFKRQLNFGRLTAVAVMLILWGVMCALEVSPNLHNLLHKDAQSPAHNCLVTQFQHHLLLPELVAAVAPVPFELSGPARSCGDCRFSPAYDYRLSPSRAPPALASLISAVA
jgi:hypothetical protein